MRQPLTPATTDLGQLGPIVTYKPAEALYTEQARAAGLEGTVVLSLIVDKYGLPREIAVIRGLGLGLDESAINAVSNWHFRPALLNGQPAETRATVEVNFSLKQRN